MLRRIGAFLLAVALLPLSGNSFRQVPNEFRDSEPGSLLFGLLHLVIGLSALVAAVGLVRSARWASRAIGICGVAAVGLLVSQPLYEPMAWDAARAILLGAALVGVVAAGASWCARRLTSPAAPASAADLAECPHPQAPPLLPDARISADAMLGRAPREGGVHPERQPARDENRPPSVG